MTRWLRFVAAIALGTIAVPLWAHKPSDSYLTLEVLDSRVAGQWDIALRDLDFAIGLDADQDDAITWGEVKARHADIAAYALSRLRIGPESAPCPTEVTGQLIDNHSDGAYAVLRFIATCAAAPKTLTLSYHLFFDLDPQHRGLVRIVHDGATRAGILSADAPEQRFTLAKLSPWHAFVDYGNEGIWHIWTGYDHILFLLSLLLPAVLVRSRIPGERWQGAPDFRAALLDVVKVVTAFTLAHSITLSLAALGVVSLPSRLVESAIALSVVLAALNNLWPIVFERRWLIAFCFGLIHGFGFASVLADLGLPQGSLLIALVAFNLGVEVGQLAIVSVFLPVAYVMRNSALYRRGIFMVGSSAIALIALGWLIQRAFNLQLIAG